MTSYHVSSTGSQRSVGPRRIKKVYKFEDGTTVAARSPFEARRASGKLHEIPVVDHTEDPKQHPPHPVHPPHPQQPAQQNQPPGGQQAGVVP